MTRQRFWHPFADMRAIVSGGELVIDRAEGSHVFDTAGRRYLDATASLWYCNVGHGRGEIADAAAEQMRRLEAYSTFGDIANRPVLDLAERLAGYAPVDAPRVFLTSGGSDSIDTAVKLARRYWQAMGQHDRTLVVSRTGSYHGMHLAGTSLAGIEANRAGYGALMQGVDWVAWDSAEALGELIGRVGPERVAGFFCEPVIGAGGVFHPPPGYLSKVRDLCRETGVLFVADEVVTGFGRVGSWFASERFALDPDLIVCAKGVTSGYLPLGAVIATGRVAEPFFDGTVGMWRHGYTYSGHATVAAAALANLDIIEREGLLGRSRSLELELAGALRPLESHQLVSEVRVAEGVLAAVQLDPGAIAEDATLPVRAVAAARSAGVLTRSLATGAIHVSPPLVITTDELAELADGLRKALDEAAGHA
ncbi:MAG TPA: aminotransferase class III-fold pyridoxal phosphate-dependent enzyme [Actinomycetes bacterium]|nr:aminotransferase class III-fold pyridoxal phosphate-dependent enzyme [Actinomycetes bacterium]